MQDRVAKVVVAALVLALLASVIGFLHANKVRDDAENAARVEMEDAVFQAEEAHRQVASHVSSVSADALGLDSGRMASDEEFIRGLLQDVCTWSSVEEYEAMRERVLGEHGVPEDSWLVSEFLPVLDDDYKKRIRDGRLNMTLSDVDVRCLSSEDDVYRYFVQAEVSSTFSDQTASSLCAFFFTVDGNKGVLSADGLRVTM